MKKIVLFTAVLMSHLFINAQVLIDDSQNSDETPHPKAILELRSTSKGLLLPRVEGTSAITTPQAGMVVFDKTDNIFKGYNGTEWVPFSSAGSSTVDETPTASNVDFTGDLINGQELQGTYTYSGGTEGTSPYSWNSATDVSGTGSTEVANTQNYTLTSTEIGKYVQFCVMPVNNKEEVGDIACSDWKGPIQDKATPPTSVVLLQEEFTGLTSSNQLWEGNDNFTITSNTPDNKVYPDDNALKLGSRRDFGSITSKELDFGGGNITVTLNVKSWDNNKGHLSKTKITVGSEAKTIEGYSSSGYEEKTVTFNSVAGTGNVIIETLSSEKEKRVFIDNITITKEE